MAKQTVIVGSNANDGSGDAVRTAFTKINENISEIYSKLGDGSNLFSPVQQGGGTGQETNKIYIGWSGSSLKAQVDNVDLGTVQTEYANKMLGVGQSWQNLTTSRSLNTTYTNTTGKPILISIIFSDIVANGYPGVFVDEILISQSSLSVVSNQTVMSVLVPSNSTYRARISGNGNLASWLELR